MPTTRTTQKSKIFPRHSAGSVGEIFLWGCRMDAIVQLKRRRANGNRMTQALSQYRTALDRSLIYHSLTWQQFESIRAGFGEAPGVRLFYYNNTIEIFMPGREHELFKSIIGLLVELFCLEKEIEFEPTGSATWEEPEKAATQADESYCFGGSKSVPDLAIEVVFTSGGTNKLERYQAIGIAEVWFWEDGAFFVYCLRDKGYERVERSQIPALADLDLALLTHCVLMAQTSRLEAVRAFRQGIR